MGYTHAMTLIADERRRVTLPKPAQPGDVFAVETHGKSQFVLTRLERPAKSKIKLVREGGLLVAVGPRRITMAETRKLMDEFP